jgi:DNA topoisomerase-1
MSKNLLIVESPAKAKTIEKYLGGEFKVKSSFGHIRDLDKGNKGIDKENGFEPKYVVSPEKKKIVKELKDSVKQASEVWLATDEDREGEAISWHLCEVLGLDVNTTKRIVFREITKSAIQSAITTPRKVDVNLVNAQQARRILDRLVGFELSEVLWRKVKNKLSAGRVQSVAVMLIVEKEREINGFNAEPFFKILAYFNVLNAHQKSVSLKAELSRRLSTKLDASGFLEKCKGANFKIDGIDVKPIKRKPAAPFTTSTLQQEASRKLGFSVNRTMSTAQRLYEQGLITYMRTDSTSLSSLAMNTIASEIKENFGENYLKTRQYKSKDANAQEAHEAIRPTYIDRNTAGANRDQERLYELIWKRTIASQMSEAIIEKTTVHIGISTIPGEKLNAIGEVLKFDGFLKVYIESKDEDDNEEAKGMLPPLKQGQVLDLDYMEGHERFTRPPARYTEASLVKKLEELGIGRPSTYAPTITKIMEKERGYVTKESREGVERVYTKLKLKDNELTAKEETEITGATSNRLYPSDLGMIVTDFLKENFGDIINYGFTAGMEKKFDEIASGGQVWKNMISQFYGPFHKKIEETLENAGRARAKRELGIDPETGYTVLTQMTRFGPVVQIGTKEEVGEEGKPKFANLAPGLTLETITFEEAIKLFGLPKELGEYKGEVITVNSGRFGPYVKFKDLFVSLPRGEDPFATTLEHASELIDAKLKEIAPIGEYQEKPITKGKGRFGPFLKWNNMFINIPKRIEPESITMDQVNELIEAKIEKEANRYIKQWEEEKIAIENGRWGPFFRHGKKSVKIPKVGDKKLEVEQLKELTLEQVKDMIEEVNPGSFKKKTTKKKTTKTKSKA